MSYKEIQEILLEEGAARFGNCKDWHDYVDSRRAVYAQLAEGQLENNMISEANWIMRAKQRSAEDFGIYIEPGDICFMDFGQAYINEMGYQHFGLVMSVCEKKALVIPMTSNPVQYARAYDPVHNPAGRKHLMRIGKPQGMARPSVLFLNDLKFVNTARVINPQSWIDPEGELFREVQRRMTEVMFSGIQTPSFLS
ncbi:MAG: hypothetical protein VZT48_06130 [Bulleidia sp.]|nr:hypothetical protein [Bulleidia sp.]